MEWETYKMQRSLRHEKGVCEKDTVDVVLHWRRLKEEEGQYLNMIECSTRKIRSDVDSDISEV